MEIPEEIRKKLERDAKGLEIPMENIILMYERACDKLLNEQERINMDLATFQKECFDLAYLQLKSHLWSWMGDVREADEDESP
jgi:hypothetical protein